MECFISKNNWTFHSISIQFLAVMLSMYELYVSDICQKRGQLLHDSGTFIIYNYDFI